MTDIPPHRPPSSASPPGPAEATGADLLGDLQRLAGADAAVLDSIGRLLDDLRAAASALPAPEVDTDAIWARVESLAWGPN